MAHHHSHRERGASGQMVRARTTLGNAQAAGYVDVLAQALRAGGVTVRNGGGLVALRARERVAFELEAGDEGTHSVVRLTLRWETPVPEERLEIVPGVEPTGASRADAATEAEGDLSTE